MEYNERGWYKSTPNSDLSTPDKPDQRKLPVAYPQLGGERDLATGCGCSGNWQECKWGKKQPHGTNCSYHRFEIMCDKFVDKDGKEYN